MGIIKDPTSWRAGFELGLAGFSFPYSKPRKPTAYLYNGIRLPALPEWDRGKYPYAWIYDRFPEADGATHYYVVFAKTMWYDDTSTPPSVYFGSHVRYTTSYTTSVPVTDGSTWNYLETDDSTSYMNETYSVWANKDILDKDGEIRLAGSEPVPVYE